MSAEAFRLNIIILGWVTLAVLTAYGFGLLTVVGNGRFTPAVYAPLAARQELAIVDTRDGSVR